MDRIFGRAGVYKTLSEVFHFGPEIGGGHYFGRIADAVAFWNQCAMLWPTLHTRARQDAINRLSLNRVKRKI